MAARVIDSFRGSPLDLRTSAEKGGVPDPAWTRRPAGRWKGEEQQPCRSM
jgi:hypothetical protein